MLHRDDPSGLIVISQTAHAWVSGQLARNWGNAEAGAFEPHEEVCLAAEQHDIGWIEWEQVPVLNPATGHPCSFMELPKQEHIRIWASAAQASLPLSRYAALLIANHGMRLYERNRHKRPVPDAEEHLIQNFLEETRAFTDRMCALLRADPRCAPFVTPELLARNKKLLAVWDFFSLLLCMGIRGPQRIEEVPAAQSETALTVSALNADASEFSVAPWPFSQPEITLVCEGRRLPERFQTQHEMLAGLAAAPWVRLTFKLIPAR